MSDDHHTDAVEKMYEARIVMTCVVGLIFMMCLFGGEPDLADGLIHYLMKD